MKISNVFHCLSACFLLFFAFLPFFAFCQLSEGGVPLSFSRALPSQDVQAVSIDPPSAASVDQIIREASLPYRFAVNIPVDYSILNSGIITLKDGIIVWRLSLKTSGAKAISLYFDRFRIPEGGRFFVYNPSRTRLLGAFTARNNNSFGTFATSIIPGDGIILEYNAPSGLSLPDLNVSELAYAFRGFPEAEGSSQQAFSETCEVNVNCPEGANWQRQKRGVVKIQVKDSTGSRLCSGSLINNTRNDGTPYVLTANHCGSAARPIDLSQWIFYFNYETSECFPTNPNPSYETLLGAAFKAHGNDYTIGSDFYLVKLTEQIPDSVHAYFNGWSRVETPGSPNGTGIHHPAGDYKKISTYTDSLVTGYYSGNPNPCYWKVVWAATENGHGVTEGGSSGSPIFNSEGQIVGTLTGGDSDCSRLTGPDYYGKFSWHWDKNGSDSTKVLKCWLDPDSTGLTIMDGWALGIPAAAEKGNISIFPNPAINETYILIQDKALSGEKLNFSVVDVLGNIRTRVSFHQSGNGKFRIDLQELNSGLYFIIISGKDFRQNLKLIKI
jgi:hypothetical protein